MQSSKVIPSTGGADLVVTDLRAEQCTNLFGTEARQPRLSWRIEAKGRGLSQSSYRVRAAASPEALAEGESLLWDSGVVHASDTFGIPYGGSPLTSGQRLWWDVEISDNAGRKARSAPTWMEAGLLSADDWHAEWIEAEDELAAGDRAAALAWIWSADPLDPRPHGFRLDFTAPSDLVDADILVAGKDNLVGVWVNGDPAELSDIYYWGTLTAARATLRPGENSLCIAATANTKGFWPPDGGAVAALVRLHRASGAIDRIVSDKSWRVAADPPHGWYAADFEAAGWARAQVSGARVFGDPRPPEPAVLLRTEFAAKGGIVAARLYATALGVYEVHINGRPVSDTLLAPEPSVVKKHVLYQCYDVGGLITTGDNVLAFTVADGFYAGAFAWRMERYSFGPAPRRLLAQLRLDYADGTSQWVATGPGWRIAESAITAADIYGGQSTDARAERGGWDRAGFDARDWRKAAVGAEPGAARVAQTSPPLRPRRTLHAASVSEPAAGRFVFDFGQNFSGWARLRVRGEAGARVTLRYAEVLAADGTVDQANLRRAEATDRYILRGDPEPEVFEPHFTYHGFRYVEVEGYPGTPDADDLEAIVVYSDCPETGTMEFESPLLAGIWKNAVWSQRSNFFAVPTDCPQRDERLGWMGDIQVFLDAAAFNMDVGPFIRRYLREARAAQTGDGAYPIVMPVPLSYPDLVTAGWSEAGIILPYMLWWRYGDTAVIEENWAAMERWMDFVARDNADHIWRNNRGMDLGDWLSVDAKVPDEETTPRILCATAYWAWCARLMAEMADATGRAEAAARYRSTFDRIKAAFADELVTPEGVAGNGSQTSQVLALYMDLVPDRLRGAAARVLADDIAGRGMKLSTGFLGTPYLLDVLADAGEFDSVRGLLLQTEYPSWGYMVKAGATTIWERWNGDVGDLAMNSYNHYALGAVAGFFYRRLAGIAPAAPGFRRIAVRPIWLPEIGRVAARYDSCAGQINTRIEGDYDGITRIDLTVPPNCVAEVELQAGLDWWEGDVPLGESEDVLSRRVDGSRIRVEVGSGEYSFNR
jgi:alpha-L-rhamnosidase